MWNNNLFFKNWVLGMGLKSLRDEKVLSAVDDFFFINGIQALSHQ